MISKPPTEKEWENFVKINSKDSYSMAVPMAVLMLWETGVKGEKALYNQLMLNPLSEMLSGFQAESIIQCAMCGKPDFIKTLSEKFNEE